MDVKNSHQRKIRGMAGSNLSSGPLTDAYQRDILARLLDYGSTNSKSIRKALTHSLTHHSFTTIPIPHPALPNRVADF